MAADQRIPCVNSCQCPGGGFCASYVDGHFCDPNSGHQNLICGENCPCTGGTCQPYPSSDQVCCILPDGSVAAEWGPACTPQHP
jgi:hypothetical protein